MLSKEEIEGDNTFKMSNPLITNAELNAIDNNLNDFVNQITKQVIHEKDLLVAQHIIKKQKEYIDQLETKEQKLIEKLEERRRKNNNRYGQAIDNDDFPEMYEYSGQVKEDDYILKIVKGEKE